ncbi:MAG: dihydropteroate synthase [Ferrimicrobium sp.]
MEGKRVLRARDRVISLDRPCVMGILNRTPDSFFDHGSYYAFEEFLRRAERLVLEGADILDVGGVKAGPGEEVSEAQELDRVVPAIEALSARFEVAISVDTWRSSVLSASVMAGAHVGNDISGFADPDYLGVAASNGVAVIATHIRLVPRVPDPNPVYSDLVGEVREFLLDRVSRALSAGVGVESVVIDAGFDLGKTTEQSLTLLGATEVLGATGYPVLISASNKGFLGELLNLGVTERRMASIAAAVLGYAKGAAVFRVHDVRGTRRALDTIWSIRDKA